MDEPTASPQVPLSLGQAFLQRDRILIAILLLFAAVLHAWVIAHTEVAARDSIAFIRYAWQLEHEPTINVMKKELHPPLYPLMVLAVSFPVRHIWHGSEVLLMQYSAQVASTLSGLLLIFPMFYLGKELFDRRVGFWSALLFQCLPVGSRALSDGLTEGLFLLWIALGLLLSLRAFRNGSWLSFGLIGSCGGLAYLTRPEGVLLPVAAAFVLLTIRAAVETAWSGRRKLACLASLTTIALAVSLPYMIVIGGVTNKTTGKWIFQGFGPRAHAAESVRAPNERPAPAPLLAGFVEDWKEYRHVGNLSGAFGAICQETGKSFHYIAWFPALLGLWWFRALWHERTGVRVILVLCLVHLLLLFRVGIVAGYVSERHTLLMVLCFCPWAIAGTFEIVARVSAWGDCLRLGRFIPSWQRQRGTAEVAVVALLVLSGLPGSLKPLHSNRAGHRAAGAWLAEHARPWDNIFDPFCWAEYYSGRVFCKASDVPPGESVMQYIVMDTANHHSRIPQLDEARRRIVGAPIRFHWPDPATGQPPTVQIYEVLEGSKVAHQ